MASAHLRVSSVSAERGGGWGHLQGAVCMAAAGFTCKKPMVGTGWPNSHSFRGFSSGREGFLGSDRCLSTGSADFCRFINEWVWLKS